MGLRLAASPTLLLGVSHGTTTFWWAVDSLGPWNAGSAHGLFFGPRQLLEYGGGVFMAGATDVPGSDGVPMLISTVSGADTPVVEPLPSVSGATFINGLAYGAGRWVAVTDNNRLIYKVGGTWYLSDFTVEGNGSARVLQFVDGKFFLMLDTGSWTSGNGDEWVASTLGANARGLASGVVFDTRTYAALGVNPAHALYYNRIDKEKGAEPRANINNASLTAGADKLYAEGFGLCLEYDPAKDTPDSFEERICKIIGGSFERSLVDGQWYLSLARGDYDIDTLPILSDDDILMFRELPTTLDRAVNSLSVRYFDVERKETVITPAARALGLIRRFGEMHETLDMPEISNGRLALIVAMRELRARVTPTRAFELDTDPESTRDWLRNSYFRLQSPERRIGDMVCILGEKQNGILRSGAIRIKAAQDIYSQDETVYIEIETSVDTRPPQTPLPIEVSRVFEAPYIDVAAGLAASDLAVLPNDAGYLLGVAATPTSGLGYSMFMAPDGGNYAHVANGEWCPNATTDGAISADPGPTLVALAIVDRLDLVVLGSPVLVNGEICRVDAIDPETPSVTLGRGCADTVPVEHPSGTHLWFFADYAAVDSTQYTDGETIGVKLLTNTGSQQLAEGLATPMLLTFHQRQSRPYPPGLFRLDAEVDPASVLETGVVTWAHRDRLLQADQLVDNEMASIGPEPTTRYGLRLFDDTSTLIIERMDIAGDTATFVLDYAGTVTLELFSISDLGQSWQKHERTFAYTPPAGSVTSVITAPTYTPSDEVIDGGEVTP